MKDRRKASRREDDVTILDKSLKLINKIKKEKE